MSLHSINELVEKLEKMSHQELTKFTKQCICQKLYTNQPSADSALDPGVMLDMIHTEYLRRDLEKHYDMTCESVAKNPDVCSAA